MTPPAFPLLKHALLTLRHLRLRTVIAQSAMASWTDSGHELPLVALLAVLGALMNAVRFDHAPQA